MWESSNAHATDIVENICPYCGEHLIMNKRSFANHVRWCKKNPKYEEIRKSTSEKVRKAAEKNINEKKGKLKKYTVKCAKCGKEFEVEEREKEFPLKEKYYCSRSCANSHKKTEESKKKTSDSLKKYAKKCGLKTSQDRFQEDKICLGCGRVFHTIKAKQKFCSNECAHKYKQLNYLKDKFENVTNDLERGKLIFNEYKKMCSFKFSLNDYPEEFDFSLIEKNGWYKAKNHGNNLRGISRDHIFSINEAFKNGIDPYYISHPANCKLMLQSDNASKNTKCEITFDELKKKIVLWNEKYGKYENKINYNLLKEINYIIIKER